MLIPDEVPLRWPPRWSPGVPWVSLSLPQKVMSLRRCLVSLLDRRARVQSSRMNCFRIASETKLPPAGRQACWYRAFKARYARQCQRPSSPARQTHETPEIGPTFLHLVHIFNPLSSTLWPILVRNGVCLACNVRPERTELHSLQYASRRLPRTCLSFFRRDDPVAAGCGGLHSATLRRGTTRRHAATCCDSVTVQRSSEATTRRQRVPDIPPRTQAAWQRQRRGHARRCLHCTACRDARRPGALRPSRSSGGTERIVPLCRAVEPQCRRCLRPHCRAASCYRPMRIACRTCR